VGELLEGREGPEVLAVVRKGPDRLRQRFVDPVDPGAITPAIDATVVEPAVKAPELAGDVASSRSNSATGSGQRAARLVCCRYVIAAATTSCTKPLVITRASRSISRSIRVRLPCTPSFYRRLGSAHKRPARY
jgi:hypothetical protein